MLIYPSRFACNAVFAVGVPSFNAVEISVFVMKDLSEKVARK